MVGRIKNGGEKRGTAQQPKQLNNSSETAIATAQEYSKIKIKASKIEQWLSCKMAKGDRDENG